MGQADHLGEIGQRAFAAVVLPVGIGDERHRRVERQVFRHRGLARGVERQHRLQPHHGVDDEEAADMEEQHGEGVGQPVLLARLIDAGHPVQPVFDRPQDRRQKRPLAVEDAGHVAAERLHQRDDDRAV